jgi:Cytochrome b562
MKTLKLLLVLFSFASVTALADTAPSLKDNMKTLGGLFKQISDTVADSTKNADNSKAAAQVITLFQTVQNQVPDTVAKLPDPQKTTAYADFQRIIGLEIADAQNLKAAFDANDNKTAANIVNDMTSNKKDGHNKYR